MGRKKQLKHSLFTRILVRLTVPLFILAAIVTSVQLIGQIQSMNRYFQVESRLIFVSVQRYLDAHLGDPAFINNSREIRQGIKNALALDETEMSFSIYDLFDKSTILSDGKPWTESDSRYAENSIYQKQKEKRGFLVQVDKKNQLLTAYIPHEGADPNHLYVSRVIYPLAGIEEVLWSSRGILFAMIGLIFLTGAFIGRGLAKSIVNPVRELNRATEAIMSGKLGNKVSIKTGDELEALADAFNHMSDSLKMMKESAEDTNPLTHLPGNNGIKFDLQRRLHQKQKFVLFHSDLDRFKVFNDVYGLAKGDAAITKTADLLKEIIQKEGDKGDFVGHQGGDDFVLILKPTRAKKIAETIIKRFDEEIVKALYPKEDFERGYVEMLDRRGAAERGESEAQKKKFPLLGFSLAGVTNSRRDFADYNAVLREAVKVKKQVKAEIKSSFLIAD